MDNVRNYLNKSRILKCTNCGNDLEVKNLADYMQSEISGDMGGETGIEYKYSFSKDVVIKCNHCLKSFKIKGCLWYAPDENFFYDNFSLFLLNESSI